MEFYQELALNYPFRFGEQHPKQTWLSVQFSFEVLVKSFLTQLSYEKLIDKDHRTLTWLEEAFFPENSKAAESGTNIRAASSSSRWKQLVQF